MEARKYGNSINRRFSLPRNGDHGRQHDWRGYKTKNRLWLRSRHFERRSNWWKTNTSTRIQVRSMWRPLCETLWHTDVTWTLGQYKRERLEAAEMGAGRRLKQARCRNKNKWTSAAAPCERMKIYTLDTVMKRKTVLLRHNIFMKNFFERKISKKESSVPTKTLETSIKGRMKTQWTNETDYVWRGSFNTSL